METEVSTKTLTEINVDSGTFSITCFSDLNDDGTTHPSIFKSQLPNERMTIDNVDFVEGELALSYKGDTVGEMTEGVLTIEPADGDNVNNYSVQNQELIYTKQ